MKGLKRQITLWNKGMGLPRFSCFPFLGLNTLASNSSVSSWTNDGGRRNLALKSAIRGHSTRRSLRSFIVRFARHLFSPHCRACLYRRPSSRSNPRRDNNVWGSCGPLFLSCKKLLKICYKSLILIYTAFLCK